MYTNPKFKGFATKIEGPCRYHFQIHFPCVGSSMQDFNLSAHSPHTVIIHHEIARIKYSGMSSV